MRVAILLTMLAAGITLTARSEPPDGKERSILRPVLWWSDLDRVSAKSGAVLPSKTTCITDPKEFDKEWARLGFTATPPNVNFKEYVVVVVFRINGLDYDAKGGLAMDAKGNAKVVGVNTIPFADSDVTDYTTTIGVFPRRGITTINGQQLPAIK